METEIMAIVSQAPALAIVVWLIMRQEKANGHKNGNGANLELVRAISASVEKLADAQVEANKIQEQRARSFEKWVDFQQQQASSQFQSRNRK
jgi:hypothetical protein